MLYFLFDALGVGDIVWPILFPILGGTFGIMFIVLVIVGLACKGCQGPSSGAEKVRHTYSQPTYHTGDYSEGAVYTVPVYCPHCKYNIELNQVEWVGSSELTCPNCFRIVEAGIRENL